MKSRELYSDCVKARDLLSKAVIDNNKTETKILWFACLAMLRAVGHVLKNVDAGQRSKAFQNDLASRYRKWKNDPVFSDFIEKERNLILKEYESALGEENREERSHLLLESGDFLLTESGQRLIIGTSITSRMVKSKGAYANSSPVDVVDAALQWWNTELNELEKIS